MPDAPMPDAPWLYDSTDPEHCLWCLLVARQRAEQRIAEGQQRLLVWLRDQARQGEDDA